MEKNRLEAFSDGVIAIIITIMVLEMKAPHEPSLGALAELLPIFLSYVLSFFYVAIYWHNHHHMLHTVRRVNGRIMWANSHLLFWLSLIPFTTAWSGENYAAPLPNALYGFVLLMCAVAYTILEQTIISSHGREAILARAIGDNFKGKLSLALYCVGIGLSFVDALLGDIIYLAVALIWMIPDRRIEKLL